MCTVVGLPKLQGEWERPPANPLNEVVWRAWVAKGRAHDLRIAGARMNAVKSVSIAGLLLAVGLSSQLAPYDTLVRFLVALGALVVMFQAFQSRHYALAAVFAALVLLFNPIAPVFSLSGGWQRVVVIASTVPFAASFPWGAARLVDHD